MDGKSWSSRLKSYWRILGFSSYDPSDYWKEHPGGNDSIILASGEDVSEDFLAIHSDIAKSMLSRHHIGILQTINTKKNNFINPTEWEIFFNPKQWSKTILKTKNKLNHMMHII